MGDALLTWLIFGLDLAGLQQTAQEFVSTATPADLAMYGGGGVGSLAVVRWLLKRGSKDVGTTPAPTSVSTAGGSAGGIVKDEAAFTLPAFLPLSKGVREVSHNEVHALELGSVVGFVSAWLLSTGRTEPVVTIVIAFVAGSLGFKKYSSKAVKTTRMEPWYALLAFVVGAALGWNVFISDPGMIEFVESALGVELDVPI